MLEPLRVPLKEQVKFLVKVMRMAMLEPFCVIEASTGRGTALRTHKGPSRMETEEVVTLHTPCTLAGPLGPVGPSFPPSLQANRSKPMKIGYQPLMPRTISSYACFRFPSTDYYQTTARLLPNAAS